MNVLRMLRPFAGYTIPVSYEKEEVTAMKHRPEDKPMEKAKDMSKFTAAKTDPMGSWTGSPLDPYEVPVQDADDL